MCGCNSGKNAAKTVEYQVRFPDGTTETFATTQLANAAIRARKGGTLRAVAATVTAK